MSEIQSEIQDDRLIRFVPLNSDGNCTTGQNTIVITKEEFLACFNEWVLKPMQENPVSVQSEFYVPVDNIHKEGRQRMKIICTEREKKEIIAILMKAERCPRFLWVGLMPAICKILVLQI